MYIVIDRLHSFVISTYDGRLRHRTRKSWLETPDGRRIQGGTTSRTWSWSLRAPRLESDCEPLDVLCCLGTDQGLENFQSASSLEQWAAWYISRRKPQFFSRNFGSQSCWKMLVVPGDPGPEASASPASWMVRPWQQDGRRRHFGSVRWP